MKQKIKPEDFISSVNENIKKVGKVVYTDAYEIARQVAKEGVKKLKETSPRGKGRGGSHYADGWGISTYKVGNRKFSFTAYNKTKPGLTHLLENGHALNWGGYVSAKVHIKPVEEWCKEEYERRLERKLEE